MPQNSGDIAEREARARLPRILADLLGEDDLRIENRIVERGDEVDLRLVDSSERVWLFEVKSSASPGHVARAAEQLERYADIDEDAIGVLVVPFMTKGAAEVADRLAVNWIDLAGNAEIRAENLRVHVEGRENPFRQPGRPGSPFAPRRARVTRAMLLEPDRWWRQRDLAAETGLDDGNVSRVVRLLEQLELITRNGREYRPTDPDLLLAAWADEYRLNSHDVVGAHMSGSGLEITRELDERLRELGVEFAFTGLAAAWAFDQFARFRLTSVYVTGDPREMLDRLELRRSPQGANIQLIGPNDDGVLAGVGEHDGLRCVAPVQAYLDLQHLPERAAEAAEQLRARHLDWHGRR